jgi:hypothetical protein
MGLAIASIMDNVKKYYKHVGIYTEGKRTVRDTLPVSFDPDKDGIVSNKDVCADSKKNSRVYPSGCAKKHAIAK